MDSASGLGSSVLKLSYLPEAHTDFIFAVIGEELGLAGVLLVIGLFALAVGRGLYLGLTGRRSAASASPATSRSASR